MNIENTYRTPSARECRQFNSAFDKWAEKRGMKTQGSFRQRISAAFREAQAKKGGKHGH